MSTDWQMPRRHDACVACAASFEIGAYFRAYLYETPAGYERRDFCLGCTPAEPCEPIGSWRARRPEPSTRRVRAFDREAVLGFFQSLAGAESPEKLQFRFVLALLLWRKRMLKFESSEVCDGVDTWVFLLPATGERCRVGRPDLDETRIEELSRQVEDLLAGGPGELESVASGEGAQA